MSGPPHHADDRFRPLRPASGARLVGAIVLGPFAWFLAFVAVAWLVDETDVIEVFLLITLCSILVALVVLLMLRAGRDRERRRYERG